MAQVDHETWYFDLDGTLVEYDVPFSVVYETALERLGVEPGDEGVFSETFFHVIGEVENPLATAIAATDIDVDPGAFSESMAATERDHVRARPAGEEILEALSKTHRLGVLTNGLGRIQRGKLEKSGLAPYFDTIVVASEVGAWKPDSEIYRIAEDRLPGASYTFVADDLERDLLPALERGWRGIHLDLNRSVDSNGRPVGDGNAVTTGSAGTLETITDLHELRVGPHR